MKNKLIQKKIFGLMRYVSAVFLALGIVLLMRMDVDAEVINVEVNIPYFAEDLVNKSFHFTVPSSGRIRFCFDHCMDPKKVRIYDFDDRDLEYYNDDWYWMNDSSYFYSSSSDADYDWYGAIYWKTGLENRDSNWFIVNPGDHYARMRNVTVNSEATFTIQYETAESFGGTDGPNDKFDSAVEMELNKQYWGSYLGHYKDSSYLNHYSDSIYYHFTLTEPSKAEFSFTDIWNDKPGKFTLYYEDQRRNTKSFGEISSPKTMRLEQGSYYIKYSSDDAPEYTLMVNAAAESSSEYEQERNNIQSQANEKEVNKEYTGNINQYGYGDELADEDWFKFVILEKSYLKMELTVPRQANGSVTAQLYKDSQELCELESGSNPYVESEEQILPSGTYYIRVSEKQGDADWDYKIRLSQREFIGVTGIELAPQKSLKIGENAVLSAVVKPDNASEKKVKWVSSDDTIVFVNQTTGEVTAKKGGTAVITAQAMDDSGIEAACEITVLIDVSKIEMDSQRTMKTGEALTLSALAEPDDASKKTLEWSSSNPSVASVDQTGKVEAKEGGTAVITAQATDGSGVKAVCEITVLVGVSRIEMDSQKTMRRDEVLTLSAAVKPDNASDKTLIWSSSKPNVVSVNEKGEVTAKRRGTAIIKAQAADGSGTEAVCEITVLVSVSGIELDSRETMRTGEILTISAEISPDNASDKTLVWSSSNPNAASVDQTGKVEAKGGGTTIITAQAADGSGVKATWEITVLAGVERIKLAAKKTVKSGKTINLSVSIEPANAYKKTIKWSSSNKSVASVDKKGKVTAKKKGTAVITAQATDGSGVKATCKITVTTGVTEAKKFYKNYYNKKLKNKSKYPSSKYKLYDINQDGIPEMFMEYEGGVRIAYNIYTLSGNKVKLMSTQTGVNEILYNAGKKQICIVAASSAFEHHSTLYQMKGIKLKKIAKYTESYKSGKGSYYKDGKKISASKYKALMKKMNKWPSL